MAEALLNNDPILEVPDSDMLQRMDLLQTDNIRDSLLLNVNATRQPPGLRNLEWARSPPPQVVANTYYCANHKSAVNYEIDADPAVQPPILTVKKSHVDDAANKVWNKKNLMQKFLPLQETIEFPSTVRSRNKSMKM